MDSRAQPIVVVLYGKGRPVGLREIEQRAIVRYAAPHLLADRLPGADVLFLWEIGSDVVVDALPSTDELRWIHTWSGAADRALAEAAERRRLMLTNSRGIFDEPVAEYVLAMMLAFAKDLRTTLMNRRDSRRRPTERLAGSSALIVGAGPIARAVGRKLSKVGVAVTAAGTVARESDPDLGKVVHLSELQSELPRHDWLILACPVTPTTAGLIDGLALRAMRPTARLINISRTGLLVGSDLVRALDSGQIAGAALDLFNDEHIPETSRLWDLPNVVISPHMSGDVRGWREELLRLFAENLTRYAAGESPHNLVRLRRPE